MKSPSIDIAHSVQVDRASFKDPGHLFLHRVNASDLDRYGTGLVPEIQALCGKVWAPTLPVDLSKPRCRECFPPRTYKYAIAA